MSEVLHTGISVNSLSVAELGLTEQQARPEDRPCLAPALCPHHP